MQYLNFLKLSLKPFDCGQGLGQLSTSPLHLVLHFPQPIFKIKKNILKGSFEALQESKNYKFEI